MSRLERTVKHLRFLSRVARYLAKTRAKTFLMSLDQVKWKSIVNCKFGLGLLWTNSCIYILHPKFPLKNAMLTLKLDSRPRVPDPVDTPPFSRVFICPMPAG